MPFNLLLLPLLAGYLYLSKSNVRSYWTAQLQKEQLLFSAATYGLLFLLASRAVVLMLLHTRYGLELATFFRTVCPFAYSGTAVGTVILAVITWQFSNFFVNEETAGHWLYHRGSFDSLTGILWQSSIGSRTLSAPTGFVFIWRLAFKVTWTWLVGVARLLLSGRRSALGWGGPIRLFRAARAAGLELAGFPLGEPDPIMLNMKDSKVIVGILAELPAMKPNPEFITIVPVWTGYRDAATNLVHRTIDYANDAKDPSQLSRVIRTADIASATIWSDSAFPVTEAVASAGSPASAPVAPSSSVTDAG